MEKSELMQFLSQALSNEEISSLSTLDEIEELLSNCTFENGVQGQIMAHIQYLRSETISHSKSFSDIMKTVVQSKKNEF